MNIVATAAKMRACGAPYQTSFEGFYGIGAKSAFYKPFVDATRHIVALQQHVHHQDLVGDLVEPSANPIVTKTRCGACEGGDGPALGPRIIVRNAFCT